MDREEHFQRGRAYMWLTGLTAARWLVISLIIVAMVLVVFGVLGILDGIF